MRRNQQVKRDISAALWGAIGSWLWQQVEPHLLKISLRWRITGGLLLATILAFVARLPELAWPVLAATLGMAGVAIINRNSTDNHRVQMLDITPGSYWEEGMPHTRGRDTPPGDAPTPPHAREGTPLSIRIPAIRPLSEAERVDALRRQAARERAEGVRAKRGGRKHRRVMANG